MIEIKVRQLAQLLSGMLSCSISPTQDADGYLTFETNLWADKDGNVREEHELEDAECDLTDAVKELLFSYLCLWSGGNKCDVNGEYSRGILEVVLGVIGKNMGLSLSCVKDLCYDKCIASAEEVCDGRGEDSALEDLVNEMEFVLAHWSKPKTETHQVCERLKAAGVTMEALDDLTHETASSIASDVNNSSLEAQVQYLLDNGVTESHIGNVLGISNELEDE